MPAKSSSPVFVCTECGAEHIRWAGKCTTCGAWGTVEEFRGGIATLSASLAADPSRTVSNRVANALTSNHLLSAIAPAYPAVSIMDISATDAKAEPSGLCELDRVLGGGIVPGAVILLAGEPGIGKSTLLLEVATQMAKKLLATSGKPVLYVTGEESVAQVRLRAQRIGALSENLYLAAETEISTLLGQVENIKPGFLVVDSVQTIVDSQVTGSAGSTTQVRSLTSSLVRLAKTANLPIVLVGHVTKDGSVAGPRVLEHLVDVVCQFEGDKHSRLRLLRTVKNRFGPTDEVGCFDMDDDGILELPDPSGIFLTTSAQNVAGTCVTVSLDGRRALITQIQSLVTSSFLPSPRRSTSGIDSARVQMTLAVLQARLGLPIGNCDIYVSTVGGAKTTEPAVDIAIALAVLSAQRQQPLRSQIVALGEVGITGEIRKIHGLKQRLLEAQRLGFTQAIVPAANDLDKSAIATLSKTTGINLLAIESLATAAKLALTLE